MKTTSKLKSKQPPTIAPVAEVTPSPTNPRKHFDKAALQELTDSVKAHGVLQPVLVRPFIDRDNPVGEALGIGKAAIEEANGRPRPRFELVCGERRWRAAKAAGVEKIPIVVRELDDKAVLEIQVVENLQRDDLHPLEEAEGYERLMKRHQYAVEDLAAKVGKSKAYIYGRLKLLNLGGSGRKAFWAGVLSPSVALLVARVPEGELQDKALVGIAGDRYVEPLTHREAAAFLQRDFMQNLKGAPFDVKAADLVKGAGPCAKCPKRTGNQPELFSDVDRADVCTDPDCFKAKTAAHRDREIARAEGRGIQVLSPEQSRKVWQYGYVRDSAAFVEAGATCDELEVGRGIDTWKKVLGKKAPGKVLAVRPTDSRLIELYPKGEAMEALKATGRKLRKNQNPQAAFDLKRHKKRKDLKEKALRWTSELLERVAGPAGMDERLWPLLAEAVLRTAPRCQLEFVARRRADAEVKPDKAVKTLERWVAKEATDPAQCAAFIVEVLLCANYADNDWNPKGFSKGWKALVAIADTYVEAGAPKKKGKSK